METKKLIWDDLGVKVECSVFAPVGGVDDWHVMLPVEPRGELFDGQLRRVYDGEDRLMAQPELQGAHAIMKRYFLSDAANQRPLMKEETDCAYSFIQQQPLDGSKVGVWMYLQKGTEVKNENGMVVSSHNGYKHLWKMGMHEHKGDSAWQTESLLIDYEEALQSFGATLANNCIRTWFFVRDVDTQYGGMVRARRENFEEQGLTSDTHFIASTGISGNTVSPAPIGIDFLSVKSASIRTKFLQAPDYLNPTYQYGVAFERGTSVDLHGVKRLFISGTASLDKEGKCLYIGDVRKQAERLLTNIDQLLKADGSSLDRLSYLIVYLRDLSDYSLIQHYLSERFPHLPMLITLAPVCRSQWLIECEGMAIQSTPNY